MWEAIGSVLNGGNALQTIISAGVFALVFIVLVKTGLLKINTKYVQMSAGGSSKERAIIREQCDWAHTFIMGLESKVVTMEVNPVYGGYQAKYILESVYDEVVRWITFNHMNNSESYIHAKQIKIASLVYSFDIPELFKTPEFNERMHKWVKEVITELISIREIYSK